MTSASKQAIPQDSAAVTPGTWIQVDTSDSPSSSNIDRLVRILKLRRRLFFTTLVGVTAVLATNTFYKYAFAPVYEGNFSFLISDPVSSGDQGGQSGARTPIASVALNATQQDIPTLIKVLESPSVVSSIKQKLSTTWPSKAMPKVTVQPVANNVSGSGVLGVLQVTLKGGDPEVLSDALDITVDTYLNWSLEQRRQRVNDALLFLDEQAPALESKTAKIQAELEAFRLKHRLLVPEAEAAATRTQVDALNSSLISKQAELARLKELRQQVAAGTLVTRNFVSQSTDSGSDNETTGGGSTTNIELTIPNNAMLGELTALDTQIATARAKYVPGSPLLKQLESARQSLIPQIQVKQLEAIDAAMIQYQAGINATQSQISKLESNFNTQPGLLRRYSDLERRLQMAEGNVQSYLTARENFQLEMAQETTPWKIISSPKVSSSPVSPNVKNSLMFALLLGAASGIAVVLLRERFDHVFHSSREVRDDLNETLLGYIPRLSKPKTSTGNDEFSLKSFTADPADAYNYHTLYFQEAFRNLAASLRFLNIDKPIQSITVTSSVPAEGKSISSILLAKTLTELGQKVLLVDADLRKPQLHSRLDVDNMIGLSQLLADSNVKLSQCIQKVPGFEGWDVITAGRTVPDPPRLLGSQKMAEIIHKLENDYGYNLIIIDTPPALGLSDSSLVAERTDGLVLVVSLNQVDRNVPKEALRAVRQTGATVLGVVANAGRGFKGQERGANDGEYLRAVNYYLSDETPERFYKDGGKPGKKPSQPTQDVGLAGRATGYWSKFLGWVDTRHDG